MKYDYLDDWSMRVDVLGDLNSDGYYYHHHHQDQDHHQNHHD